MQGRSWRSLPGIATATADDGRLSEAVAAEEEDVGRFSIERDSETVVVDAWSNTIEDDDGVPMFWLCGCPYFRQGGGCTGRRPV